jgi:hypothetical protein
VEYGIFHIDDIIVGVCDIISLPDGSYVKADVSPDTDEIWFVINNPDETLAAYAVNDSLTKLCAGLTRSGSHLKMYDLDELGDEKLVQDIRKVIEKFSGQMT